MVFVVPVKTKDRTNLFLIEDELVAISRDFRGRVLGAEGPTTSVYGFPFLEDAENFRHDISESFGSKLAVGKIRSE